MDNQVEEIKNRLDIVDVVSEYVNLKPAGSNFKGTCPFHNEKTPSFMVSPERQIFHCFGCGAGGDMFTFIMKIEGVEFPEALRILAQKAGVELRRMNPQVQNEKNKLKDILLTAEDFFHKNLFSIDGQSALNYLTQQRRLTESTIKEFKIGWAGSSWDDLLKHLQSKGYNAGEIVKAGLAMAKRNGAGHFNRFRERIMFPIADAHGSVVGFTGRILVDQENSPKYMNTPETPTFNKSYILYALDKAKSHIRQADKAVIVEGQMDVIASHQAGVKNVIASSGTALTIQQIKLIKRYTETIVFALDADFAGQKAIIRGDEIAKSTDIVIEEAEDSKGNVKRYIDPALSFNLDLKVASLGNFKDPDEAIKENVEIWKSAIENAKPVMEYYFDSTFAQFDVSNIDGKKQAGKVLIPVIAKFANKIEQDYWTKELAQRLHVSESAIYETLHKMEKVQQFPRAEEIVKPQIKKTKSRDEILSERFLALILSFSDRVNYLIGNYLMALSDDVFAGVSNLGIAKAVKIYYNTNTKDNGEIEFNFNDFVSKINELQLKEYAEFLLLLASKEFDFDDEESAVVEAKKLFRFLENGYYMRRSKILTDAICQAEKSGDKQKLTELLNQYDQLIKERSKSN